MRFCPFCSAENADELAVCQSCGRRLPPLPPRRARNAPATGVLLPPRATGTTQPPPVTAPRRTGTTNPPPHAPASSSAPPSGVTVTTAGVLPTVPNAPHASGLRAPGPPTPPSTPLAPTSSIRETATGLPPPPMAPLSPIAPGAASSDDANRALANALSPGPAAQRREAPPPDLGAGPNARRRTDSTAPSPGSPRPVPSILGNPPRLTPQPGAPGGPPPISAASPGTGSSGALPPGVVPGRSPASPVQSSWAGLPALQAQAAAAPPPQGPLPAPVIPGSPVDPPWAATGRPHGTSREADASPPRNEAAAASLAIAATRARDDYGVEPPPTRIHRPEALVDRPFTPPSVSPVPEIPEPGLINSARYTVRFARARWQRRGAIRTLGADIKKDTDALDQVLGALGGVARTARVDGRVFSGENAAITAAEERAAQLTREHNDVDARKLEENSKFVDVERERNTKLGEAERMVDEVQKELAAFETQRRGLRDKRKELERRQRAYLKAAEDNDRQAGTAEMGEQRQDLRRGAEQHRKEAAALEPERQDIDRKLASMERPISEATARLDAAKAELDAAKRSLADAREGHTHRLAELDAEQKRKAREIAQAEAEIARRLVTLGTLVNLNRIEDPQFTELYDRIDRLRGAITARTTEI
ncbi:MAG TPA: hypothetical protein VLM79_10410, partial [Kofleriaceae bacterium]|nr:hypothetical protein [Kofleriaceae bacterium]